MFLIPGAFVMSVSALMALLAHVGLNDGEGMVPSWVNIFKNCWGY